MINSKDMLILQHLRKNTDCPLAEISRMTGIPVTTIYDRVKAQKKSVIKKSTVLLDFAKLGYHTKAKIVLKVNKNEKTKIEEYILAHENMNSFYRINYGYDYLIEAIFRDTKEAHAFVDELEERFEIREKHLFFVVEEIERERFVGR